MQITSERVMFLLANKLAGASVKKSSRPKIKIVIVSSDNSWSQACISWIYDTFGTKLKTFPTISSVPPKTRACPLVMDHPNCLVLVQGVDNSDAIHDFAEKNKR